MHPILWHASEPGPGCPDPVFDLALSGAEFQKLDRGKVTHIAPDALGRVEKHVRFGAEGITQYPQIWAFGHGLSCGKIPEGHRVRIHCDVGHVFGDENRISHQTRRLPMCQAVRPQESAV